MDPDFLIAIIEKADVPIAACDAAGERILLSAAARELFSDGRFPPDHPLFRALKGERFSGLEMIIAPIGAPVRTVILNAHPVVNQQGRVLGAVATYQEPLQITTLERQVEVSPSPDRDREGRVRRRANFVTESMKILAASPDAETGLSKLAQHLVLEFADWCLIDLREGEGSMRRVSAAYRNSASAEVVQELESRYPSGRVNPVSEVIETGKSEWAPRIPEGLLETIAQNAEHFEMLQALGLHSFITVPLIGLAGTPLGAITVVTAESGRTYDEDDLSLAEELAARAALVIENMRTEALLSEARAIRRDFDLLLQSTAEGICGIDIDGRCRFVNSSASAMLGYGPEDLLGRELHDLIHYKRPDGSPYPSHQCEIRQALRENRGCSMEHDMFLRSDGTAIPVEYSTYPITEDGQVTGAIITFTDNTEKRKMQEQVRASEAKFRGLFDHLSEGIYQTSPQGELLAANRALVEMLGYESEMELRAQDVNDLYAHREDRERTLNVLNNSWQLQDVELHLRRKDGQVITVVENARVVTDARSNVIFYEGTLRLKEVRGS